MIQAKNRHLKLMKEELQQPYIFRDKQLIVAENILLFSDFYNQMWTKLSQIAIAIQMVNVGLNSESDMPKQLMVAKLEKLQMLVDKQDALDVWN